MHNKTPDIKCLHNQPMSEYTTMHTGGAAASMYFPQNQSELETLLQTLPSYVVLGRGSNLIVCDEGLDVPVINMSELCGISLDGDVLTAEAGAELKDVCGFALEHSLEGLEFACGIPGTVGGAVFMNAGAYGGEIKDVLLSSLIYDNGFKTINNTQHDFSYRHSSIGGVVVSSSFQLKKSDREQIRARMDDLTAQRAEKQPLEEHSAGSTFKRPLGYYAGKLLTDTGLKGYAVGGAAVSEKHAGFVINKGGASSKDILDLIAYIRDKVKKDFGVELMPEVRFLERDGSFKKF